MAGAAAAIVNIPMARGLRAVPRRIRVLTVDANPLVQEGLAATIYREDDMALVAAASSGNEGIGDVRQCRPEVVILDLWLPDMPGEDLARQILAEFPSTRIVAILSAQGPVDARRALAAGVHGLLSKAAPISELVQAIRLVNAGATTIPGPVLCRAGGETVGEKLTPREVVIQRISATLSIARETVRMHLRHILETLNARNRTHAATIAAARGELHILDRTNRAGPSR